MTEKTVGIIGGCGWMGRAIGRSMLKAGFVAPNCLILSGRSRNAGFAEWPDIECTSSNRELMERADVVVLAVHPEQFAAVKIDAHDKLVISIMAGISAGTIQTHAHAQRVVRAMPNAAAEIARSYTPWFAVEGVPLADKVLVQALFETCGVADEVPRETDIDYLTGMTGSGPAFPALLAKAMLVHALAKGIPADIARRAVEGVIAGASQLVARGNESPEQIVQTFLDYRGTTAAALRKMIGAGFAEAVHAGLEAAEAAAVEMSQSGSMEA